MLLFIREQCKVDLYTLQKRLQDSTSLEVTQDITVALSVIYDNREDDQQHHLPGMLHTCFLLTMSLIILFPCCLHAGFHSFYYRVAIENNADFPVRLVGRYNATHALHS